MQKIIAEPQTDTRYDTDILAEGNGSNDDLRTLAEHGSDHHDECREVPGEGFEGDYGPFGINFGSIFFQVFHELVKHVQRTAVVKVVFRYEEECTHIAVVGPQCFQRCTSLEVLRCGF